MARLKIRHLIERSAAGGGTRFYWQPSRALAREGFKSERLADDRAAAIAQAEKLNAAVDAWRAERQVPVAHQPAPGTVKALIVEYRRSARWRGLAPATQRAYHQAFARIESEFGAAPVRAISRRVVHAFYQQQLRRRARPSLDDAALARPCTAHAAAVIRVLRLLLQYALDLGLIPVNPAVRPAIESVRPRQTRWTETGLAHFIATADTLGHASIGTAALLAGHLGQREGDVLKLTRAHFDGECFKLRQGKTRQWIEVPATKALRQRLARQPADQLVLVRSEATGKAYRPDHFRHVFARVRAAAAKGVANLAIEAMPEIADLWFMDLRRSAAVWMAEAGATEAQIAAVTGHDIEHTRRILETYLPRTGAMAAAAIERLEAHRERREQTARQANT